MGVISVYNELNGEIEILEIRIQDLIDERNLLLSRMTAGPSTKLTATYSDEPKANFVAPPLDKQFERLQEIDDQLDVLVIALSPKKRARRDIESKLKQLEGLHAKVFYMHIVEGKSLNQIASQLNYSHEHIRRINAEIEKAPT